MQVARDKVRADRLDSLIADAERNVAEQALCYEMAVFDGQDGVEAKKTLRIFEDVLFEAIRAKAALAACRPKSMSPDT